MANFYTAFSALFPRPQLKSGVALTTYGDDTVLLQTPDAGTVRVLRGGVDVLTGQNYYYRGTRLEGAAPNLTTIEVETP